MLIFLLGSLGDTLVALPALHLVARRFPAAERRILSDLGVNPRAASMVSLLEGSGLAHGYFRFPPPQRGVSRFAPMWALSREIRAWRPDVVIYLREQRGWKVALRDAAVFRLLGIPRVIGLPLTQALQRTTVSSTNGYHEHRTEYMARSLASLGDARLEDRNSWDLRLSADERERAGAELAHMGHCTGLIAMSIGTKVDANDWGDDNWRALLHALSANLEGWGLVCIGAAVERERSSALIESWRGASVNLCGRVSARESGAVLERVAVFVGHDSGPMHLAASVGTRCVAIFSARNPPGLWFPYGRDHRVFYKRTDCAGCGLEVCLVQQKKCIAAISVPEVADALLGMLRGTPQPALPEGDSG